MNDMMRTISEKIKATHEADGVVVKPYYRPESLGPKDASIVIVPMNPPKQSDFASDQPLRKQLNYQINIEASSKEKATQLALTVEKILLELDFFQLSGGLDDYFPDTGRYVDARRYRGYSDLYDIKY